MVTHMEAQLSGTATAIALADHSTPSATQPGTVRLDLIPTDGTHTPADGKPLFYTALRRLPAMHPSARQVLTLRLAYSNGQVQTLRHDLTQALRTFNHYDAGTPPFEADLLVELAGKPGSGLGFSIRPWTPGGGDGNGDAGMEIPK